MSLVRCFRDGTTLEFNDQKLVNATRLCHSTGKKWSNYVQLEGTARFVAALSVATGLGESSLIVRNAKAINSDRDTWVHIQIAINLASWISPEFNVWATSIIMEYLGGGLAPPSPLTSCTGVKDWTVSQVYLAAVSGEWRSLRFCDGSGRQLTAAELTSLIVIKFGFMLQNTGRLTTHAREFGGCFSLLDSLVMPGPLAFDVEKAFKNYLKAEGRLMEGVHGNRGAKDTELIVLKATQADYNHVVQKLQDIVDEQRRKLALELGGGSCGDQLHVASARGISGPWQQIEDDALVSDHPTEFTVVTRMVGLSEEQQLECDHATAWNLACREEYSEPVKEGTIKTAREFLDLHCEIGKDEATAREDPAKCFRYAKRAAHDDFCKLLDDSVPVIGMAEFCRLIDAEGIESRPCTWPGEGTMSTFFGIRKRGAGEASEASELDKHMAIFLVSRHVTQGTSLLQNRATFHTAFRAYINKECSKAQIRKVLEARGFLTDSDGNYKGLQLRGEALGGAETIDGVTGRFSELHARRRKNEIGADLTPTGRKSRRIIYHGVFVTPMYQAFNAFAGEGKFKMSDFNEAMKRRGYRIGTIDSKGMQGWAEVELI